MQSYINMKVYRPIRYLLFVLCSALLLSAKTHAENVGSYTIQPGDVLEIGVWDEPDLQRQVVVLPDYTISFPLTGVTKVFGVTVDELTEILKEDLAKFIPAASVHIAVIEPRGSKAYVLGKVNRPGEIPLDRSVRVLQALSVAGGLTTFADEDGVKVVRRIDGRQESIDVPYGDILDGEKLDRNIELIPGDVVVVK